MVPTTQSKPIFNKRLYKAHAGITISKQASNILHRHPNQPRSESDLRSIRSVVAGLKDIHKTLEFVKRALGHAVSYEKHESDVRIEKKMDETRLSCYYILSGSVEAFYTVRNSGTPFRKSEEQTISSTNVAGDYIGLVSADGANFDFPPPEFMTTIENSEFLRIDRAVFHEKIQEAQRLFRDEIVRFLDGNVLFAKITEEDRQKLVQQMVKQEFPAGKQILSQGQKQEHAFFVAEGRCVYYRRLYLSEQRRSELFKMGYVEKGSYFDASCIIDDQSSKFSVSAVGPVTCYLLNKWTVKNSESLLRALSINRPSIQTDQEIECLVKESDQWLSYKRDTVCDAFASKNKTSRIISHNDISRTLDVAIKHGTILRQQRRKEMITSRTDDLDPIRRKSGGCSPQALETTEGANAKSILKAVMLMRRSRGSREMKNQNDEINPNLNVDEKDNNMEHFRQKVDADTNLKNKASENCIVSQNRNTTRLLHRNKQKHPGNIQITTKFPYRKNSNISASSSKGQNGKRTTAETSCEKNIATRLEPPTQDRPSSSPIPYTRTHHRKPEYDDRWVTNDKKFKVKEIVNTRIPGKELPVSAYRRFEPSIFEYLDKMNSFEKEMTADPFSAKLKARVWLKQAKKKLASRGCEYHPGQSPIIVIEEFCAGDEAMCDEETGYESRDPRIDKVKVSAGSMDPLYEDSDKENAEEEVKKFEWRTAVHETRYEAECCLEQAKTDIAILERQLEKLGWTRDMLIEKERKRNERTMRKRSNEEKKTTEKIEQNETESLTEKQIERKIRTLKRQDSIQKILDDRSKRPHRRYRSFSDEKPHVRRRTLIKRYSTGNVQPAGSVGRFRTLKTRTLTVS